MAGKSLADYAAEAQRKPFTLVVDEKTSLSIEPPTVDALMAIEEASTSREALSLIAGGAYEPLMKALKDQPAGVLEALLDDMRKHFGLGN